MHVHLVDGTYELFRHYFAVPSHVTARGNEVGAVRGVVGSMAALLADGATHVAVATDHVVESFRNDLWDGYKDGSGIEPDLLAQFPLIETALEAMGLVVWPMKEFEADDGLAAGAHMAARDPRVSKVIICTPDKDLAQCVVADRVVQLDRRRDIERNEGAVFVKFGVGPQSIPDYLALVGDSADGFPGVKGFGAKSSSALLAVYQRIEDIPDDSVEWTVPVRGAKRLAQALATSREDAMLFKQLATLRLDAPVSSSVDELHWKGPGSDWSRVCRALDASSLEQRVRRLWEERSDGT